MNATFMGRPCPGASQTGVGSPTTQHGVREETSMPHDGASRSAARAGVLR